MEYFKGFPVIAYDFPTGVDGKSVSYMVMDITKNVRFRKQILRDITLYDEYDIVDGETPEIIAKKVYGSPFYHWMIMLANERYDYVRDFPLSSSEFEEYIIDKYGSVQSAINTVKYYQNSAGEIVFYNPDTPHLNYTGTRTAVNCYDYEVNLNESKRRIKLISPSLLGTVMKNFGELM